PRPRLSSSPTRRSSDLPLPRRAGLRSVGPLGDGRAGGAADRDRARARGRGTAVAELLPVPVGAAGAAAGVLGAGALPAAEHGLGRGDRPRRLAALPAARRLDGLPRVPRSRRAAAAEDDVRGPRSAGPLLKGADPRIVVGCAVRAVSRSRVRARTAAARG